MDVEKLILGFDKFPHYNNTINAIANINQNAKIVAKKGIIFVSVKQKLFNNKNLKK